MSPIVLVFLLFVLKEIQSIDLHDEIPTVHIYESFTENSELGRDLSVIVIIKDFFQMLKSEAQWIQMRESKSKDISIGRTEIGPIEKGVLMGIKLDKDVLFFDDSKWRKTSMYPAGLDFFGKRMVTSFSLGFEEIDLEDGVSTNHMNEWFRHIHTLQYNHDGTKVLVSSSGFDTVIEYDLEQKKNDWEWCAYDHGFNTNVVGEPITRNPEEAVDMLEVSSNRIFVDPSSPQFQVGLPTKKRCCHISGAFYQTNETIGMTMSHRRQLAIVSKISDDLRTVYNDLSIFPHGFNHQRNEHPCKGYIVTDTRRGRVVFLDEEFQPCMKVDFAGLPSHWFENDKYVVGEFLNALRNSGEWIQFVTHIKDNIYGAVDVKRRHIVLFDMVGREYRVIPYSQYIAIQEIRYEPPELSQLLVDYFSLKREEKEDEDSERIGVNVRSRKNMKSNKEIAKEMRRIAKLTRVKMSSHDVDEFRKLCRGEYYPLEGFMTEKEFDCVLTEKSLCDGSKFWDLDRTSATPMEVIDGIRERKTVIKPITDEESAKIKVGDEVMLYEERRTREGKTKVAMVGSMMVESKYNHNRNRHSFLLYGKAKNVVEFGKIENEDGVGAAFHFDKRVKEIYDIGPVDLIGGRIVYCG